MKREHKQGNLRSFRLVILESPFSASEFDGAQRITREALYLRYARRCLRDSLIRGEAPFASHLLYTQEHVLDDRFPEERQWGIEAGLAWGARAAEATVVYMDLGISKGMKLGILQAELCGRPIEHRTLVGYVG